MLNEIFFLKTPDLELVLSPVDDNGSDLLVHEDEDGCKEGWDDRGESRPPRVTREWMDKPRWTVG